MTIMSIQRMPWYAKIAAKLILARLPIRYDKWRELSLFRHGKMDEPQYVYDVFLAHSTRAGIPARERGFTSLELGPGDSLCSALVARALGGGRTYLVDVGRFAREDMSLYREMGRFLSAQGFDVPDLSRVESVDEMLRLCNAIYLTDGLRSLAAIPSGSVDFVFSHAVLEHVRRADFLATQQQIRRVLHPEGACSHHVDLRDHLGGGLNNLRFSETLWESQFMASSGFYTNRIRYAEMLQLFTEAGFEPEPIARNRWDRLPLPVSKMDRAFHQCGEEDLTVFGFDVILRPRGGTSASGDGAGAANGRADVPAGVPEPVKSE